MSAIAAKAKIRDLAAKAQAVATDAAMTQAEKKAALDAIETDIKSAQDEIAIHERVSGFMAGAESVEGVEEKAAAARAESRSIGRQVIESEGYKSSKGSVGQSRFTVSTEVKAAGPIAEGTAPSGYGMDGNAGTLVTPNFLPGIVPLRFQRLTIADLLPSGTTDSSMISYVVETAFNNAAAPVAEKGKKPLTDLAFGRVNDQVGKIAHLAKITDEMYADAPALEAYISNRLIFGVQRAEEDQLLNGSGYPGVKGLLQRTGLSAVEAVTGVAAAPRKAMEGVYREITKIRTTSFAEPDAIVMHPTDWQNIRLAVDGNGQYYAGGPFMGSYGNPTYTNVEMLWGVRVVVTTAIPAGTVLVGAFSESAQVFRRTGITVEMTNSNVDDFENNLLTLRAEERLALAVYRPSGFGTVTLAA